MELPGPDGELRKASVQTSWFDWDGAVAELLDYIKIKGDKNQREAVMDLVSPVKQSNMSWSASKLDLSKVPPWEIGKAIHDDEELYSELQHVLNIVPMRSFIDRFTND